MLCGAVDEQSRGLGKASNRRDECQRFVGLCRRRLVARGQLAQVDACDPGKVDWSRKIHTKDNHCVLGLFSNSLQSQLWVDNVAPLANACSRYGMVYSTARLECRVEEFQIRGVVGCICSDEANL